MKGYEDMAKGLTLALMSKKFGVYKFDSNTEAPDWIYKSTWYSVTKTKDELSVVCDEEVVPREVLGELGWRCLKVLGPLEFEQVGILAKISKVLAENRISIFVVSTYDTDYILVKEDLLEKAINALALYGYEIRT